MTDPVADPAPNRLRETAVSERPQERLEKLRQTGGSAECESAVSASLEWLKGKQNADGSFTERKIMGATDPAKADAGTIRKLHGSNVGENAVHGSDSLDNAKIEIAYFFRSIEICPRG